MKILIKLPLWSLFLICYIPGLVIAFYPDLAGWPDSTNFIGQTKFTVDGIALILLSVLLYQLIVGWGLLTQLGIKGYGFKVNAGLAALGGLILVTFEAVSLVRFMISPEEISQIQGDPAGPIRGSVLGMLIIGTFLHQAISLIINSSLLESEIRSSQEEKPGEQIKKAYFRPIRWLGLGLYILIGSGLIFSFIRDFISLV